jgi:hypothetical protein
VIPVDTSQQLTLSDGRDVNEAFEFSGYQYGLQEALAAAGSKDRHRRIVVAFLNGTALTSHLRLMLVHCLRCAFSDDSARSNPTLSGFRHSCEGSKSLVATRGYYVPTFAFSLSGTVAQLEPVELYDREAIGVAALAERHRRAGAAYTEAIDAWLSPRSWISGWYRALPNRPIDPATRYRKSLAIYLEHSLVTWLAAQGIEAHRDETTWQRWSIQALMSMDRAYVNTLKLRYRLAALTGANVT